MSKLEYLCMDGKNLIWSHSFEILQRGDSTGMSHVDTWEAILWSGYYILAHVKNEGGKFAIPKCVSLVWGLF